MSTPHFDDLNAGAIRGWLTRLMTPGRRISISTDEDGELVVDIQDPPPDLKMSKRTEVGLRALGLDVRLIRAAARCGSAADYLLLKTRLEGRRR